MPSLQEAYFVFLKMHVLRMESATLSLNCVVDKVSLHMYIVISKLPS